MSRVQDDLSFLLPSGQSHCWCCCWCQDVRSFICQAVYSRHRSRLSLQVPSLYQVSHRPSPSSKPVNRRLRRLALFPPSLHLPRNLRHHHLALSHHHHPDHADHRDLPNPNHHHHHHHRPANHHPSTQLQPPHPHLHAPRPRHSRRQRHSSRRRHPRSTLRAQRPAPRSYQRRWGETRQPQATLASEEHRGR